MDYFNDLFRDLTPCTKQVTMRAAAERFALFSKRLRLLGYAGKSLLSNDYSKTYEGSSALARAQATFTARNTSLTR